MKNLQIFKNWKKSEMTWLLLSVVIILISSLYDKASLLELSTGLIGIVYVILIAKGYNVSNIIGIFYVSIYGIVAWNTKFYGDMLMNVILIPLYIIAFLQWRKHTNKGIVEVRNLSLMQTVITGCTMVVLIFVLNLILSKMGGNYTLADSANSILTITALILTIGRYSQQWICWLTNNVISTVMWVMAVQSHSINASFSIATLKVIILANSIWGLTHWIIMGKREYK